MRDGTRFQVVGVAENGKYTGLTENPQSVMFVPILQAPSSSTYLVVHSNRDPQHWGQLSGFSIAAFGSAAGLFLGILATPVLAFIVDQATPRDPLVLAGVVLAMALLGLLATWIPARRALSVDPMILLREE